LANEVKCSHGATTSKIDEQELFYLLSRGIPRKTAEKLVVLGFFDEIIREVNSDKTLEMLKEEISNYFN
jgi:Fe-S cluster assembly protein SufD